MQTKDLTAHELRIVMTREWLLDASELSPPEPLQRALAILEQMQPGQYLRMLHRREPFCLFELLDGLGFEHAVRQRGPGNEEEDGAEPEGAFEVLIWRRDDAVAALAAGQVPPGSSGSSGSPDPHHP